MDLFPAVDLRGGRAVRLVQGDFDRETAYGDPVALARSFAAAGAPWLHVVDLDAARTGEPVQRDLVLAIAAAVPVPVQTGGGVRTDADVDALLAGGVARVVLGTAALDDPDLVRRAAARHPGRVAVGLDHRRGPSGRSEVAVRGWEEGSGRDLDDVVAGLTGSGVAALVVTAIDRDGTLEGPDLAGLAAVVAATDVPVVASGGVGSPADLAELAALVVEVPGGGGTRTLAGAITGRALVDGRMTVEEALAACAPSA
ncbi:MAG: HisA/HisF-related TIM barrel protein [Actinomycetota bacterium]|jgi:phosphoribosylformimino-5-aminoimidazole carboxamide ribotide isomerase|nr:HisA/HisF-related TIM barrel protein [Actinomycetota bacterium]